MSQTTTTKRKASLPILIAGGVSSLVLALGMTPTFAAFSASIANSTNTAGTGTLVMEEKNQAGTVTCLSTDGGSVSTNAATCATINKYGGDLAMIPGQTATTTITIKNTGTIDASSFSFAPGACVQSVNGTVNGTATDLCAKTTVTITANGLPVYTGTALALGTGGTINMLTKLATTSVPASNVTTVVFAVKLDATMGNTYQGLKLSQPMTWTFGA
ncbi:MAG: hypothetical protein ACOH16_14270 [Propionibacteriaceae bacterium]